MSKPSKKTSGYPSAPKSFVSHLLTRSSGQPAPIRAWVQVRRAVVATPLVSLLCVSGFGLFGVGFGSLDVLHGTLLVVLQPWRPVCLVSSS